MGTDASPSPDPKLTEREVLEEILTRDRREYPVMTITQVAERFDDVSRKTVQRKMKALAAAGDLRERKLGKVGVYWDPQDGAETGVCPACGRMLVNNAALSEDDDGLLDTFQYSCTYCGAEYAALKNPDGTDTTGGRVVGRALALFSWWGRIGKRTRGVIRKVVKLRFRENYPNEEYPEVDLKVAEEGLEALSEEQNKNPPKGVLPDEMNDSRRR